MNVRGPTCLQFIGAIVLICVLLIFYSSLTTKPAPAPPPASTAPELSDSEKIKWMCKYLHTRHDRTPVGDIPLKDIEMIQSCKALGLW
jgi:hypothetical protein